MASTVQGTFRYYLMHMNAGVGVSVCVCICNNNRSFSKEKNVCMNLRGKKKVKNIMRKFHEQSYWTGHFISHLNYILSITDHKKEYGLDKPVKIQAPCSHIHSNILGLQIFTPLVGLQKKWNLSEKNQNQKTTTDLNLKMTENKQKRKLSSVTQSITMILHYSDTQTQNSCVPCWFREKRITPFRTGYINQPFRITGNICEINCSWTTSLLN